MRVYSLLPDSCYVMHSERSGPLEDLLDSAAQSSHMNADIGAGGKSDCIEPLVSYMECKLICIDQNCSALFNNGTNSIACNSYK